MIQTKSGKRILPGKLTEFFRTGFRFFHKKKKGIKKTVIQCIAESVFPVEKKEKMIAGIYRICFSGNRSTLFFCDFVV